MADEKKNPLIGAFRTPVPGVAPPGKPPEPPGPLPDSKAAAVTPAKPDQAEEARRAVQGSR